MSAKYLRICSDLHLEGFTNTVEQQAARFVPAHVNDADSILVLAGDISSRPIQLVQFVSHLVNSDRFKAVMYVPGNHEFYRQHFEEWCAFIESEFADFDKSKFMFATSGVSTYEYAGCRFILSTLWGDGGKCKADQDAVSWFLNDFRLIRCDAPDRKFLIQDMVGTHKTMKARIESVLNVPFSGKTIVVTHHLPSRRLVSPRFWPKDGSDGANGGFVGECDDILAKIEIAPSLWIHGHTHDRVSTSLWNTRIECNPTGYRGEWGLETTGGDPVFVELASL